MRKGQKDRRKASASKCRYSFFFLIFKKCSYVCVYNTRIEGGDFHPSLSIRPDVD